MADNFKDDYNGSMDSKYHFSAGRIGATTSPQVANQIGELTSRLNQGLNVVEVGAMNQRLLDQVPTEHFTEMRRLNKLTGSTATLHAPIQDLDLAGFTQQGWNDGERINSVAKLSSVLDRAHELNPDGGIPVTVHSGGMGAQKWQKEGLKDEYGKEVTDARSETTIVNQESGQFQPVRYKEKKTFGGKEQIWTPEKYIENINTNEWDNTMFQVMQMKKQMNEVQDRNEDRMKRMGHEALQYGAEKGVLDEEEKMKLMEMEGERKETSDFIQEANKNIRSILEDMNDKFERFGDKTNERYKQFHEVFKQSGFDELEKNMKAAEENIEKEVKSWGGKNPTQEQWQKYEELSKKQMDAYQGQTEILVRTASQLPAPEVWKPIDEFAMEKSSDTVAEAALNAYKKYGEKSPVISLENVYPEFPLARAKELGETVEESRKKFAEKLMKEKHVSQKKADEVAEKLIGVTWDVGHIYMLRKSGYTDEDIRQEAKKIAKYVKHAHLTDNFGFEDSHLPPGLGEVNIKEQLKELEKKGFKGHGIVEAGEFVANYKEVPHLYALEHLGSTLYPDKAGPMWDEISETSGHYFSGYGEIMPQKYFDLYGAPGFSQLPPALGGSGSSGGDKGRFASAAGQGGLTDEYEN